MTKATKTSTKAAKTSTKATKASDSPPCFVLEEPQPCDPPYGFIPSSGSNHVDITILGSFAEKPIPTVTFFRKDNGNYVQDDQIRLDGSISAQIGSIVVPVRIFNVNSSNISKPGRRYFTITQTPCTVEKADIFELIA